MYTLLAAFVFAGGDDAALTRSLATWLDAPVALMATQGVRWRPVTIDSTDPVDRRRLLRTKVGLDVPKDSWGLSSSAWPPGYLNYTSRSSYLRFVTTTPRTDVSSVVNGRVTFITNAKAVTLQEALSPKGGLGSAYEMHWMFEGAAVHVSAKNVDEATYTRTLADAVGAKLVKVEAGWKFDFDPVIYRRRTIGLLRAKMANLPLGQERAALRFDLAVIESLTDAQLTTFLKEGAMREEVWVPASAEVLSAAQDRLSWTFGLGGRPIRNAADSELAKRYGGLVDWSRPAGICWTPSGAASARYRGMEGGKPISVVL